MKHVAESEVVGVKPIHRFVLSLFRGPLCSLPASGRGFRVVGPRGLPKFDCRSSALRGGISPRKGTALRGFQQRRVVPEFAQAAIRSSPIAGSWVIRMNPIANPGEHVPTGRFGASNYGAWTS